MKRNKNLYMMIMNIMMIQKILKIWIINYELRYNIYLFIENKIYLYLYLFEINEFHPNKQYCHFLANKQNLR